MGSEVENSPLRPSTTYELLEDIGSRLKHVERRVDTMGQLGGNVDVILGAQW